MVIIDCWLTKKSVWPSLSNYVLSTHVSSASTAMAVFIQQRNLHWGTCHADTISELTQSLVVTTLLNGNIVQCLTIWFNKCYYASPTMLPSTLYSMRARHLTVRVSPIMRQHSFILMRQYWDHWAKIDKAHICLLGSGSTMDTLAWHHNEC